MNAKRIGSGGGKQRLREWTAGVIWQSPAAAIIRRRVRSRLTIVCYHRILSRKPDVPTAFDSLIVEPTVFEQHLEYYRRQYKCVTLNEASNPSNASNGDHRPRLVITIDDGYWDSAANARPILDRLGLRATFFLITSLIGACEGPWYDRLARSIAHLRRVNVDGAIDRHVRSYHSPSIPNHWIRSLMERRDLTVEAIVGEAKRLDPAFRAAVIDTTVASAESAGWREDGLNRIMTTEEIRQLADHGHEIASHTRSHPILPQLDPDQLRDELVGSKQDLERIINKPVESLAYPNGDYDDQVIASARNAGYRCAVTTESGLNKPDVEPFQLHRVFVSQARTTTRHGFVSIPLFELELSGLADTIFLRKWRRR